jgi:release factor glutamine methyltransferase
LSRHDLDEDVEYVAILADSAPRTLLRAAGLNAHVVDHRCIAFGPILRSRSSWLQSRGLLESNDEKGELVIIRAQRLP